MDPNGDYISGRFRYLSRGGGADGDEAKGTGRQGVDAGGVEGGQDRCRERREVKQYRRSGCAPGL
jgi:hypothetical protein